VASAGISFNNSFSSERDSPRHKAVASAGLLITILLAAASIERRGACQKHVFVVAANFNDKNVIKCPHPLPSEKANNSTKHSFLPSSNPRGCPGMTLAFLAITVEEKEV